MVASGPTAVRRPPRSRVALLIVTAAAVLLTAACSGRPDDVEMSVKARATTPKDDLVAVRPTPWERIERRDGGRTLRVFYTGGLDGCGQLARVDTEPTGSQLTVTVFTGDGKDKVQDDGTVVCTLAGVPSYTDVRMDPPVKKGIRFAKSES